MPAVIDVDKCSGCGICDEICPGDLIHMDHETDKAVIRYPDECWYCGSCRVECPEEAITYVFPSASSRVPDQGAKQK